MVFSSPLFLFLYLPFSLLIYYAVHLLCSGNSKYLNPSLLALSALFYVWGAPKSAYLGVFVLSIVADYYLALLIEKRRSVGDTRGMRRCVALSVTLNLAFLTYYKYANFFVHDVSAGLFRFEGWEDVLLPIGISFVTFHKISYILDVYKAKVLPKDRLMDFGLYILLFPQLIAGPIVRYHLIADQITRRLHSVDRFFEGIYRFSLGLGKKVLIANQIGVVADIVFAQHPSDLNALEAWMGILAYTMQIYFDFSGYSDMAIGLGKMFGFDLPENFDRPYTSKSVTEFWRRWHMTLSQFFRDYVYIPLGGNRVSPLRVAANLWIVFLLCGLWHGAHWKFLIWGAYHGFWLTVERIFPLKALSRYPVVGNAYLFVVVAVGWVFFRSEDLPHALRFLEAMVRVDHSLFDVSFAELGVDYAVYPKTVVTALVAFVIALAPGVSFWRPTERTAVAVKGVFSATVMVYSVLVLSTGSFNPFLYFEF
jgi:alginate O-acetyltransferase complex protein AlgI